MEKRAGPFEIGLNALSWIHRIVSWTYKIADTIPRHIQNKVDRAYKDTQDAKWEVKIEQADEKVKWIVAKEFPDFFRKKYLDPYEPGSELHNEHTQLLQSHRPPQKRQINWE